jgi:hypothetical protein
LEDQGVQSGDAVRDGTPDKPLYRKQRQSERPDRAVDQGTALYMITVDEGWRSWILCTDMYKWAADELLERLRESNRRWKH